MNTNDINRLAIANAVKDYIASGGTIQHVDHTSNQSYDQPIKRTRKAQIAQVKRRGYASR